MNEQLAAIKANNKAVRQTMIRELDGGYIIAGTTAYINAETSQAEWTENAERVAVDVTVASQASHNYLRTGSFDGVVAAPAPVADAFAAPATAPAI